MSYDQTKRFIIEQSKQEVLYQHNFAQKQKLGNFSRSEIFCLNLCYVCQKLYQNGELLFDVKPFLQSMGVECKPNGMFYVNSEVGEGEFCNANAMFRDVYCEEAECHATAYSFITKYVGGDIRIKSGLINPYNLEYGILHSICEFERYGKIFVFDGANFLVMEKQLYYKLFNFKNVQTITQSRLLKDMALISKKYGTYAVLKGKKKNYILGNSNAILRHFNGFGFLLYMYDRHESIYHLTTKEDFYRKNKRSIKELQEAVDEVKNQYSPVYDDLDDDKTEKTRM